MRDALARERTPILNAPLPWDLAHGLLLAGLLFYLFAVPWSLWIGRPGFLVYDEEGFFDAIQSAWEGGPWRWQFGSSALSAALAYALDRAFGPHPLCLRLPSLALVLVQHALLYVWVRRRFGDLAGAWAALAGLGGTATFALARGVTAVPMAGAAFLALALWRERLRRPWQAALWGLATALMALDYEGWVAAAAVLTAWAFWSWRVQPTLMGWAAIGLLAGAGLVAGLHPDWGAFLESRRAISLQGAPPWATAWQNLADLLGGGDRMLFSGAPYHPWPPRWTWPLLVLGAAPALWRWPGLALALGAGLIPLFMRLSDGEPHRFYLAWTALCAIAGMGATRLAAWGPRWARWGLPLLLLAGAVDEARGWSQGLPPERRIHAYGRSWGLAEAVKWLRQEEPADGWELLSGLGLESDASFRHLARSAGLRAGRRPVALVPWHYLRGLEGMAGRLLRVPAPGQTPPYLFLPDDAALARLRAIHAQVEALRRRSLHLPPLRMREEALACLQDGTLKDPWARTVGWEQWLTASLQLGDLDPSLLDQAAREPLVNGWLFDAAGKALSFREPQAAQRLHRRAARADPRRAGLRDRAWRY